MSESCLNELRDAWSDARAGHPGIWCLTGRPSSGRTTLFKRFMESLDRQGVLICELRGSDAEELSTDSERIESFLVRAIEGLARSEGSENDTHGLRGRDILSGFEGCARLNEETPAQKEHKLSILFNFLSICAQQRPVLIAIDDADRLSNDAVDFLRYISTHISSQDDARFMLFVTTRENVALFESHNALQVREIEPLSSQEIAEAVTSHLASRGVPRDSYLEQLCTLSNGHPGVALALADLSADQTTPRLNKRIDDPNLELNPALPFFTALANDTQLPFSDTEIAQLKTLALLGPQFDRKIAEQLDSSINLDSFVERGVFSEVPDGFKFVFYSPFAPTADTSSELCVKAARLLRETVPTHQPPKRFDIVETWRENRSRSLMEAREITNLLQAYQLFLRAQNSEAQAETAIAYGERILGEVQGQIAVRDGSRQERQGRRKVEDAIRRAHQLIEDTDAPLDLHVRRTIVEARLAQATGEIQRSRELARSAAALASHSENLLLRAQAFRVEIELAYLAGDLQDGRRILRSILKLARQAPADLVAETLDWLCDLLAEYEWCGLYNSVFKELCVLAEPRARVRYLIHFAVAAFKADDTKKFEALYQSAVEAAQEGNVQNEVAEALSGFCADLLQERIEVCVDSLSGEFFPPDLEGEWPGSKPIGENLDGVIDLFRRALELNQKLPISVSTVRIYATALSIIYDARNRFEELLERLMPAEGQHVPTRVQELCDINEGPFFGSMHIQLLTLEILRLSKKLGLHQIYADTLYEALDREQPCVMRLFGLSAFEEARKAYEKVEDAYGLCTLDLIECAYRENRNISGRAVLESAAQRFEAQGAFFSPDQRAFLHLRFGEIFLEIPKHTDEALAHLEAALSLYEDLGELDRTQEIAAMLRDQYRTRGDFRRYRQMRDRMQALETFEIGEDPLSLEFRLDAILTQARQANDDNELLGTLEQCAAIASEESSWRQDECLVEVSKICRRKADDAESEEGYESWLMRSLQAVRQTLAINRSLGNYRRVFEEYHEIFDDLLGLGDTEEYHHLRRECRSLAFRLGNVQELLYLFEEYKQSDPENGFDFSTLPELFAFYASLKSYFLSVGADSEATCLHDDFEAFLKELGESIPPDL